MRRLLAVLLWLCAGTVYAQPVIPTPPIFGGGGSGTSNSATSVAFAALGTPANGAFYYCSDCAQVNPCAGSGSGAFAFRVDGAWTCATAGGAGVADPGSNGIMARTALNTSTARTISAGTGISVSNGDGVSANPTVSIDTATTPQFSSGTGAVPATGAIGTWYAKTDSAQLFSYPATDAEHYVLSIPAANAVQGRIPYINSSGVLAMLATDTAGKVLQTNGAGADPSWVTSSSGYDYTTAEMTEEFYAGAATSAGGLLGTNGWYVTYLSTGTGATGVAGLAGHPGIWRISSHATNDNSGAIAVLSSKDSLTGITPWSATDWTAEMIAQLGSNSTSIAAVGFEIGFATTFNSLPEASTGAIRVRFDTDASDTTFKYEICDSATTGCGSATTTTNTDIISSGVTPVAGTWYYFKIRHLNSGVGSASTFYFSINGGAETTACASGCDLTTTNIPTFALMPTILYVTRTTTGVMTADIDMFHFKITGMTRY